MKRLFYYQNLYSRDDSIKKTKALLFTEGLTKIKFSLFIGFSALILVILSGCLYPNERRAENQIPYPDQIQAVQQAVEQFQQDTGVLPILTREMGTPIYQKYPVDFNQLIPRYLQQAPGNSFENGGIFQYVLVNVEEKPEVKLLNLTTMSEIREFQMRVREYEKKNQLAPIDEMVDTGLFTLQFEKLGYKEQPKVKSPYYDTSLPLLIDNNGQVYIDYRIDLNIALNEFEHSFQPGDDVREILVENSPIVPAFSIPYTIDENGEPIYFMDAVYGRNK